MKDTPRGKKNAAPERTVELAKFRRIVRWLELHTEILSAISSLITIIGLPLAIIGLFFAYVQISDRLRPPELHLFFSRPERVVFRIVNRSKTQAKDIWNQLTFLDYDTADANGMPLDLEIQSRKFDYAQPKSSLGPWALIDLSKHEKRVSEGHHVFGWASVRCSDCQGRRDYWVFIERGKGGWYAEIEEREQPNILINLDRAFKAKKNYNQVIAKIIPERNRSIIEPLAQDADVMGPVIREISRQ